jgi:hypothetical protein
VLYAAARYCCSTGTMFPLQELTKAGGDWTKPNRHGVSPLLLLLRHVSGSKQLPAAVQDELLHGAWKQKWSRQVCMSVCPLGKSTVVCTLLAAAMSAQTRCH